MVKQFRFESFDQDKGNERSIITPGEKQVPNAKGRINAVRITIEIPNMVRCMKDLFVKDDFSPNMQNANLPIGNRILDSLLLHNRLCLRKTQNRRQLR